MIDTNIVRAINVLTETLGKVIGLLEKSAAIEARDTACYLREQEFDKRRTDELRNWKEARVFITPDDTCCYCDRAHVTTFRRGTMLFGCNLCIGLEPSLKTSQKER